MFNRRQVTGSKVARLTTSCVQSTERCRQNITAGGISDVKVSFECATRHPYLCSLLNKVIPRRPPYSTSVRHRIRSVSKHHPYLCIQQRLLTTSLFFASTFSVTKVPPAGVLTEMSSNYQSPSVVVLSIDTLGVSIDREVTKLPAVGCLDDILTLAKFEFAPNA